MKKFRICCYKNKGWLGVTTYEEWLPEKMLNSLQDYIKLLKNQYDKVWIEWK